VAEPADDDAPLPGEAFERAKRRVGLVAGPVLAVAAALAGRDSASPTLIGLAVLCITWWMTEALPMAMVALLAAVGAVVLDLAPPEQAFGAFGHPILFLFVGSFFIAEAMRIHGLGERLARAMASRARGRLSLLVLIGMTTFVMSMVMSNSAATAIVLPIALSALPGRADAAAPGDRRFATAMVLTVAWSASVGGLGTPVGTPPNLYGIRELGARGVDFDFFDWMAVGVPMGLVMMAALFVVVAALFGVRTGQAMTLPFTRERRRWSRAEASVIVALGLAIVGWLLPTVAGLVAPASAAARWLDAHLKEEVVAVVAGCVLFVLPGSARGARWRPALTWPEATRIEWGVILLFGGGILLGTLAKETGQAAEWGDALVELTGATSTWALTALVTATAIFLSEATSNTATASMLAPMAGAIAAAAGADVLPVVLGATMGASFGFMMPISTAPNAMAYATGRVSVGQMARGGILFDVLGFFLILGTLRVITPLLR
jgi:sodium-dependent dicarboxylate transporter 2/3/5